MKTLLLPSSEESLSLAADLLRAGELVAFPTETVYGLGADALNAKAVLSIFAAKGRPADNPLIVHIHDRAQLPEICTVPEQALPLMDAFWPGPLTILFNRKPAVPSEVTAGLPTVAVRMPSHPVAAAMLKACGLPIAAPSANSSGRPSPTLAAHVLEDMQGKIPLILDGGPCEVGVESTVLDLCHGVPTILRPGGVTKEMLESVLHTEVALAGSILRPLKPDEKALSPACAISTMPRKRSSLWWKAKRKPSLPVCRTCTDAKPKPAANPASSASPSIWISSAIAVPMTSVQKIMRKRSPIGSLIPSAAWMRKAWKPSSVKWFLRKVWAWRS